MSYQTPALSAEISDLDAAAISLLYGSIAEDLASLLPFFCWAYTENAANTKITVQIGLYSVDFNILEAYHNIGILAIFIKSGFIFYAVRHYDLNLSRSSVKRLTQVTPAKESFVNLSAFSVVFWLFLFLLLQDRRLGLVLKLHSKYLWLLGIFCPYIL